MFVIIEGCMGVVGGRKGKSRKKIVIEGRGVGSSYELMERVFFVGNVFFRFREILICG